MTGPADDLKQLAGKLSAAEDEMAVQIGRAYNAAIGEITREFTKRIPKAVPIAISRNAMVTELLLLAAFVGHMNTKESWLAVAQSSWDAARKAEAPPAEPTKGKKR